MEEKKKLFLAALCVVTKTGPGYQPSDSFDNVITRSRRWLKAS